METASTVHNFHRTERILLAPEQNNEVHVRFESKSTLVVSGSSHRGTAVPHPLVSRDALELLTKYKAVRIRMQVASIATNSFPTSPMDCQVDSSPAAFAGPSGLMVSAEMASDNAANARALFLALLKDLVGKRRILIAPLGSSLQRRRLHRFLETEKVGNITKVTTILPMEGSHAALSTEGFRSFLVQAGSNEGIWSVATASTWSSWMLGSVPGSLDEAQTAFGEDPTIRSQTQVTHHRRGFWVDWSASYGCHDDSVDLCRFETLYGLQYTVKVRGGATIELALNDILPAPFSSDHAVSKKIIRPDPFADESAVRILGSLQYEWGPACNGDVTIGSVSALNSLDRTGNCVILQSSDYEATERQPPFWSVHSNILRVVGQANRGTFEFVVQNQHAQCSSEVTIMQTIPAVMEPVWQSLKVIITNGETKEQILKWSELREHSVDFRADGSFKLFFRHSLPQQSSLQMLLDYEPAFLSFESFPGDANRGFEISPIQARLRFELDGSNTCQKLFDATDTVNLYTNALLLLAPLPDMSMCFNVISLTCTLYAFILGSVVNLLVKKASSQLKAKLNPEDIQPDGLLGHIKSKLKKLFRKKAMATSHDGAN